MKDYFPQRIISNLNSGIIHDEANSDNNSLKHLRLTKYTTDNK